MWSSTGFHTVTIIVLIICKRYTSLSFLLLVACCCLVFTGKDIDKIETQLNNDFNSICDRFVDNTLSIHFGKDKTKSTIFGSRRKLKSLKELDIRHGNIKIKQHSEVIYLGCILESTLSFISA